MATSYREFDCTGCGENTATLDPTLIQCDDCRIAYLREETAYPGVGDFCDTCAIACDHCGEEYAHQHMVDNFDGNLICPECDDDHGPGAKQRYDVALRSFNRPASTLAQFRRASESVL